MTRMTRTPERAAALRLIARHRRFRMISKQRGMDSYYDRDFYQIVYQKLVKPFPRRAREANQ